MGREQMTVDEGGLPVVGALEEGVTGLLHRGHAGHCGNLVDSHRRHRLRGFLSGHYCGGVPDSCCLDTQRGGLDRVHQHQRAGYEGHTNDDGDHRGYKTTTFVDHARAS